MKLSPPGWQEIDEIHWAPDWKVATTDCFWRLYWNTLMWVQAKKCGFVGWKQIAYMIPLELLKGLVELLLEREWIKT